jgi:hypothetical protein
MSAYHDVNFNVLQIYIVIYSDITLKFAVWRGRCQRKKRDDSPASYDQDDFFLFVIPALGEALLRLPPAGTERLCGNPLTAASSVPTWNRP